MKTKTQVQRKSEKSDKELQLMGLLYKSHPWHGVPIGNQAPECLTAYIEMVPTDTVKYEIDKMTGYLKIDRPQKYSNVCPALYGFIPQTFCAEKVAQLTWQRTRRNDIEGDGDPLDICVLSEKAINHGDFLLQAVPIGGFRLIDGKEADDKIIAVMRDDISYGKWRDISDCPGSLIERLKHYFLTYKDLPGTETRKCELAGIYGYGEAHDVILRSRQDYQTHFGEVANLLSRMIKE